MAETRDREKVGLGRKRCFFGPFFIAEDDLIDLIEREAGDLDRRVSVTGVQGDVSKLADLDRLYETVKAEGRRIDVVFADAGLGEFAALGSITEEHFDRLFNINVKGALFTVQKALPLLNDGAPSFSRALSPAPKGRLLSGFTARPRLPSAISCELGPSS
jgi:NAD(P)-dependent dehydrogenase (short-subunit alcohol dehydrogenase family)